MKQMSGQSPGQGDEGGGGGKGGFVLYLLTLLGFASGLALAIRAEESFAHGSAVLYVIGGLLAAGLVAKLLGLGAQDEKAQGSFLMIFGVPVGHGLARIFSNFRFVFVLGSLFVAAVGAPVMWAASKLDIVWRAVDRYARGYVRVFEKVTSLLPSSVMKGDIEEVWRERGIDPDHRPELHNPDIPPHLRRALWRDGRTVLGESLVTLADSNVKKDSPFVLGRIAGLVTFASFVVLLFASPFSTSGPASPVAEFLAVHGSPVGDYWPGAEPDTAGFFPALWAAVTQTPSWALGFFFSSFWLNLVFSAAVGALVAAGAWWTYYFNLRVSFAVDTRDDRLYELHRSEHDSADTAYRQAVAQSTGYERGQPKMKLGTATGHARMHGDQEGPLPGQDMVLDKSAFYYHMAVIGATGEGKSTAVFRNVFRYWLSIAGQSAFVMDDKAELWRDIKATADRMGRGHAVRVIGTEPDMYKVDLLAGLSPAKVVAILRSTRGSSSEGNAKFFEDQALDVIENFLVIASAVERTEEGRAWCEKTGRRIYSFGWVFSMMTREKEFALEIVKLLRIFERGGEDARRIMSEQLKDAIDSVWNDYLSYRRSDNPRKSIEQTAKLYFKTFCKNPAFRDFAWGGGDKCFPIQEVFQDRIVCLALSQYEHGEAAKIVTVLIKAGFMNEAHLRQARIGEKGCQKKSVLLLIDEAQSILTSGSELTENKFSNVARSRGIAMCVATQSVPALRVCFGASGEGDTKNLLANFRTKIFLRSEDVETAELVSSLAGSEYRAPPGVGDESVDARISNSGFRLFGFAPFHDTVYEPSRPIGMLKGLLSDVWRLAFSAPTSGASGFSGAFAVDHLNEVFDVDAGLMGDNREELIRAREQEYLKGEGVRGEDDLKTQPVISPTYYSRKMGRAHAVVMVQNAGLNRTDVTKIEHIYE